MGREIEMKVPVTEADFTRLYRTFTGSEKTDSVAVTEKTFIYKKDEYFSRFLTEEERFAHKEPKVIRIRSEKEDAQFESAVQQISQTPAACDFEKYFEQQKNSSTNEKAFFTIKFKTIENGIEFNKEDETFVENADVLRELFDVTEFHKYFCKEKRSFGFMCHLAECPQIEFHAELENVNGFTYLEVENTETDASPEEVKVQLEKLFTVLGLDPSKKDSRSWMKIINGIK